MEVGVITKMDSVEAGVSAEKEKVEGEERRGKGGVEVEVVVERKPKVEVGDVVRWVGGCYKLCLVCYKVLVCLECPSMTWSFEAQTHEEFMKKLCDYVDKGRIEVLGKAEKIVVYLKGRS